MRKYFVLEDDYGISKRLNKNKWLILMDVWLVAPMKVLNDLVLLLIRVVWKSFSFKKNRFDKKSIGILFFSDTKYIKQTSTNKIISKRGFYKKKLDR